MSDLCRLIWSALIGLFRSRIALEAEILVLRQQLNVLRRKSSKRLALSNVDRLLFAGLYRGAPGVLDARKILKPENQNRGSPPSRLESRIAAPTDAAMMRPPTAASRPRVRGALGGSLRNRGSSERGMRGPSSPRSRSARRVLGPGASRGSLEKVVSKGRCARA